MPRDVPADLPLFGLPDDAFVPRAPASGVITKREVRAVALASLGLRRASCVWDVGSGTGSVAIEVARVADAGRVYAVESDAMAQAALTANCERFAARNVTLVAGRAPDALATLPAPDAVFVGGSGGALAGILDVALFRLRPGGRVVVTLASYEHLALARAVLARADWASEVTLVSIARARPLLDATRFAALNPVFILTGWQPDAMREPAAEAVL